MDTAIEQVSAEIPAIPPKQKIRFEDNPTLFEHHRGGWADTFTTLRPLCAPDGCLCISAVEEWIANDKVINEPWIGFLHQVPRNSYVYYPDLERLFGDGEYGGWFRKSLEKCKGLFVLSRVLKDYILKRTSVPVVHVPYPCSPFAEDNYFDWQRFDRNDKKPVLFIGEYLRNYQALYDLEVPPGYQKYLLKSSDVNYEKLFDLNKERVTLERNDSVIEWNRVPAEEYDRLLSSSIVFLNLYDAASTTTMIECLARNTPLVVNRLPGVTEYLGEDYPLLYETLEQASAMIANRKLLEEATQHLKAQPIKSKLTHEHFLRSFVTSSIYRSLPLPPSKRSNPDQTKFPQFDLTVVICSYKRVNKLEELLRRFTVQDYAGTFEVILWNNNRETNAEVKKICEPFMQPLNIRLIQSSENYYCIIRLAVARLIRSDLLLICDDDVIPETHYISKFVAKYKAYGPRAVLCCRGHVFLPHSLSEEEPQRVWDESEDWDNKFLKFFDEKVPDRQVHYVHAASCLIPRAILLELSSYDLSTPDDILIDDYWMSFVLSHRMHVPIWKIKGDDIFSSTSCADDASIALYHNKYVREQRNNFYVYHMREGWPASTPLPID